MTDPTPEEVVLRHAKLPGIHGEGLGTGRPNDGDYSDKEVEAAKYIAETEKKMTFVHAKPADKEYVVHIVGDGPPVKIDPGELVKLLTGHDWEFDDRGHVWGPWHQGNHSPSRPTHYRNCVHPTCSAVDRKGS